MKIITNYQWRQFKYRDEVPQSVLDDQFDYLDEDEIDGFFCYRGVWYHVGEFMAFREGYTDKWHGYHSDSFFSAVLIELSDDGEEYRVGLGLS
jgi:hypothetical protein